MEARHQRQLVQEQRECSPPNSSGMQVVMAVPCHPNGEYEG
jgi:hypothetical protein